MGKNRRKRFFSTIHTISCGAIFGVAAMSLASPDIFFCHKGDSIGAECMEKQSETVSRGETASGLKSHRTPVKEGAADSEKEGNILYTVQEGE